MNIWKWEIEFSNDCATSNFVSETSRMGAELENNWDNNNKCELGETQTHKTLGWHPLPLSDKQKRKNQ